MLKTLLQIIVKHILRVCLKVFLFKMFIVKVFSLKIFFKESLIKWFFYYKTLFNTIIDF